MCVPSPRPSPSAPPSMHHRRDLVEVGQGWRAAQMKVLKALSGFPSHFRQYRDSQAFSFCTAGHWASGQQVAKDGSGLRGVWWRQIRQFNRVSPAVADAVVTAFPSPRLLQQVSPQVPFPGLGPKACILTPVPTLGSTGLRHGTGAPESPS